MLQAYHLAKIKTIVIIHALLDQQLSRGSVYKIPKLKSACLLCNIFTSDMVLASFVTAHLQTLHQGLGQSIQQLILSTKNNTQALSPHTPNHNTMYLAYIVLV